MVTDWPLKILRRARRAFPHPSIGCVCRKPHPCWWNERIGYPGGMIALILFVLGILASPFKAKSRLEAENAALRQRSRVGGPYVPLGAAAERFTNGMSKMEPFDSRRPATHVPHGMVASSQPLAAQVGLQVLKEGGNAVDAAIAVAAMVNVT